MIPKILMSKKKSKFPELVAYDIPAPNYAGKKKKIAKKPKITYASIVPLIGGETIGVMEALNGQLPEYLLSYTPFANNDAHLVNYLRDKKKWKGEYVQLDVVENYVPKQVDVVNSVCPCAGLSSFSTTSSADSAMNEWMYKTAEYVLGNIKPKVFWGENAPRLYSKGGEKVANRLFEIAQENGYSMTLYYTESHLHGLCQKRPRTFYFFTQSENAPLFKYWRRPMIPVQDILQRPINENDPMNIVTDKDDPAENPWVAYVLHRTNSKNIRELYEKSSETIGIIPETDRRLGQTLHEVADWMDSQNKPLFIKAASRARAMQKKLDSGKGYWSHGPTLIKGLIPSLIGAMPYAMINPFEERYLTLRECMRIMSMPDDFNLIGDNPIRSTNHICQNVPVTTAKDMMHGILEYLDGNCDFSSEPFVRQSNKKTMHKSPILENSSSLNQFLDLQK
jgi:site-specific DNA-cytosine methylase